MTRSAANVVPSGFFALRSPLLPFEEIEAWCAGLQAPGALDDDERLATALETDRRLLRQRMDELIRRPEVQEALFVASPSLTDGLDAWHQDPDGKKGRRAEESLVRYLLRMASRSTPFGLFSGCSTGVLGESTELALEPRSSYRRSTRLDMDYLFALTEDLGRDPELRRHLRYFPNSSLYETAGRLRYAEARVDERLRSYHLVAVEVSEYLEHTLERARSGAGLAELAQGLVDDDPDGEIALDEALAFVHELVDSQLLVSELTPIVTGPETLHELIERCREHPPSAPAGERLEAVRVTLAGLDEAGVGSDPEVYRGVARDLEEQGTKVELPRLFQVDLVKPARVTFGPRLVEELERGIAFLHRFAGTTRPEDALSRFREAFKGRWEDTSVPLVEALDEEAGIGFDRSEGIGADASPLLRGLPFPLRTTDPTIRWGARQNLILTKLEDALASGASEIEFTEADLEPEGDGPDTDSLDAVPPSLPDAFQVMGVVAAESAEAVDRGDFRFYLRTAGGPSGARLLGRFCHADPELRRHVEAHLEAEEALDPDAVFAEVVHLPEGRLGNILARPRMRDYEIPFLGRGAAPESHRIPIDDLLVSVVGERVVLRSRRLGRRIVPRLTSAHNFGGRNQGVYRFLCSLQSEGVRGGLGWNWGQFENAAHLPRVTNGRLVLSRERFRVTEEEMKPVVKKSGAALYRAVHEWREKRGLPRRAILADGDNELYVDFDNVLSLETFLAVVKNRPSFVLKELFPDPGELCVRGPEGRFLQEVIVPFVRRREPTKAEAVPAAETVSPPAAKGIFPPGSEWLYVKLYTGTATADEVLREVVTPLVREVMAGGHAQSWFFIRYGDPDWHLRLRFRGEPERLTREVLPRLLERTAPLVDDFIWRSQVDTYRRETERYGGPEGIDLAEDLFRIDSEAVLGIVSTLEGDEGADARWRLALRGTALLLADLGLDGEAQLEVAQRIQTSFAREFRADTAFKKRLQARLRDDRKALDEILEPTWSEEHPLAPGFETLARRSRALAPVVAELRRREADGRLSAPVHALASSFVHMFNNRLLRSQARAHEVVIYDFLHQLLRSRVMRERAQRGGKKK